MGDVLVTGGLGFIGSNLSRKLCEQGHKVTIIDDLSTGSRKNIKGLPVLVIQRDISARFNLRKRYDIIFHLAALARIQPSFKNPIRTYEVNSTGTFRILEYAKRTLTPVIYAGTSSAYHDVHANPYTYTKCLGEQHCKVFADLYKLNVAVARFFNVYGPNQIEDGDYATVIGIFERQRRNNVPLTVTGTGEKRRDFTHVDDICDGLIKIWKSKKPDVWNPNKTIFQFGTGTNYSIFEVAQMFKHPITFIPERPGEAQTTKAKLNTDLIGWKPKRNLQKYIAGVLK